MKLRVYLIEMPERKIVRHEPLKRAFRRWLIETKPPEETPYGLAFYRRARNGIVDKAKFAIVASSLRAAQRVAEREWKALNGGERCVC